MAERRMFAKTIVLSDAFLDMPMSARCLYFTLNMFADDDGFVGSPKAIMRQCGASQDDLLVLLQKRFVLGFDSGVIVIKHWRINNYLRNDRYKKTTYIEELNQLMLDDKGGYTEKDTIKDGIPMVSPVKDSIGKDSIEIGNTNVAKSDNNVAKQIIDYLNEKLGTRYTTKSKSTIKHINARLEEGFTYNDFKIVIDKKVADWKGTRFEPYLRPDTLFSTKFEGYLNQTGKTQETNDFTQIDRPLSEQDFSCNIKDEDLGNAFM